MKATLSFAKYFAVLVASGNGASCEHLKFVLRTELHKQNEEVGDTNFFVLNNQDLWPEEAVIVKDDLAKTLKETLRPILAGIDKKIYNEKTAFSTNKINQFRFELEQAMKKGLWTGQIYNA